MVGCLGDKNILMLYVRPMHFRALVLSGCGLMACGAPMMPVRDSGVPAADAGAGVAGSLDAGVDAGTPDAGSDGGFDAGVDAGTDAGVRKRIFVTNSTFNGNLGGLDGGDQRCNLSAQLAGLGGKWIAWLSVGADGLSPAVNAIDRVADVGPWYRIDGFLVFQNRAEMAGAPRAPINCDEKGGMFISGPSNVWTGTRVGGVASLDDCARWTASTAATDGVSGSRFATNLNWSEASVTFCSSTYPLYCIEQ